jgi:1-acyl-sn-glycerol-3-phosphate acyltransferase
MKTIAYICFLLLKLRYKFSISGFDKIEAGKQYLIFPNHQALIDPQIVYSIV